MPAIRSILTPRDTADRSLWAIIGAVMAVHILFIAWAALFSPSKPLPKVVPQRLVVQTISLSPPPPAISRRSEVFVEAPLPQEPEEPKQEEPIAEIEPAKQKEIADAPPEPPPQAPQAPPPKPTPAPKTPPPAPKAAPKNQPKKEQQPPKPAPKKPAAKPEPKKKADSVVKPVKKQETPKKPVEKTPPKKASPAKKEPIKETPPVAKKPPKEPVVDKAAVEAQRKKQEAEEARRVVEREKKAADQKKRDAEEQAARAKQQSLVVKAQERIAKIAQTRDKLSPGSSDGMSAIVPHAITSLQIDAMPAVDGPKLSDREVSYRDELAGRLKLLLRLPEYGEVKIKLTLDHMGKVVKVSVSHSESELNKKYIEKTLPGLSFPAFGTRFGDADQYTFSITLSNEV